MWSNCRLIKSIGSLSPNLRVVTVINLIFSNYYIMSFDLTYIGTILIDFMYVIWF